MLNVHSSSADGFTEFICDIDSPKLDEEELSGMGLSTHMDLVNPGNLVDGLGGLGLPYNVGGKTDVKFDISQFVGLLGMLGEGEHHFIITVTDANGTTSKTLKIKF